MASINIFFIFGLICLCTTASACNESIWTHSFNDSEYYIYETKSNFFAAFEFCKIIGADLISVETAEENDYIKNILKKRGTPSHKQGWEAFWTSGARTGDNTSWIWLSTNERIGNLFWGGAEPNNQGGQEYCLNLIYLSNGNYYFNDGTCSYPLPAICERKLIKSNSITSF